jgi:hypothetical protein
MRIRRHRRNYTPDQEAARKELHRAERWLQIVSSGIAEALKREHYCGDGIRDIIDVVNKDLDAAVEDFETASTAHETAFGGSRRILRRVRVYPARKRKTNPPRAGKSKPSTKQKAKNK